MLDAGLEVVVCCPVSLRTFVYGGDVAWPHPKLLDLLQTCCLIIRFVGVGFPCKVAKKHHQAINKRHTSQKWRSHGTPCHPESTASCSQVLARLHGERCRGGRGGEPSIMCVVCGLFPCVQRCNEVISSRLLYSVPGHAVSVVLKNSFLA